MPARRLRRSHDVRRYPEAVKQASCLGSVKKAGARNARPPFFLLKLRRRFQPLDGEPPLSRAITSGAQAGAPV
jgi:hypothetical protein